MKKQLTSIKLALLALALGAQGAVAQSTSEPVPAGTFIRGDANDITKNAPTNQVYVSAFQMDANLVTLTLWQQVYTTALTMGYTFDHTGSATGGNYPVQGVSWYDAVKWCNARSQIAGLTPCYYADTNLTTVYSNQGDVKLAANNVNWAANGYRLPTEAEWEKAARGGVFGQRFPLGNMISHVQALYTSPASLPASDAGPANVFPTGEGPAGAYPANGFGLHDMAGNMREWCWDWFGTNYYATSPTTDPQGPATGTSRVTRGGCWNDGAEALGCAIRNYGTPTGAGTTVGFRCVTAGSSLTTPIVTVSAGTYIYNGSPQGPNAANVNAGGSTGTITLSYAGTGYGPTAVAPTAAGSYTVTATVAASGNYSQASSSATAFSISKATPTITVNVGTYIYNGSPQGPNAANVNTGGSTGAITLSYAGTGYGPTTVAPTAAGSYTVTATVAADSNYNQASSSATIFAIGTLPNGDVDPGQLATLLGTGKITLTELQAVLADYDHSTSTNIVNYTALVSFLGSDTVTVTDLLAFLNNYVPNHTANTLALNSILGATTNAVDQAGVNTVLAHYWVNNPPCITNAGFGNPTNFVFALTNFTFTVQVSTDLANWTNIGPANFQFTDTNAVVHQASFYRLVTQTN